MTSYRKSATALFAAIVLCAAAAGASFAGAPQHAVVGDAEIQAQITAQANQVSADRNAIQTLLARPAVRQLAASAGLDMQRATAAASVLSGDQLTDLAARARAADATVGGQSVTMTYATITIILLIIIILIVA